MKILGDKTCIRGQWPFRLIQFLIKSKGTNVAHDSNTHTYANKINKPFKQTTGLFAKRGRCREWGEQLYQKLNKNN